MSPLTDFAAKFFCLSLTAIPSCAVYAHGVSPWGWPLDWHNDQIEQVMVFWGAGQKVSIEGKSCLVGSRFSFKVSDEYAFDIDEAVWLDVEFYLGSSDANLNVIYNSYESGEFFSGEFFGEPEAGKQLQLPKSTTDRWYRTSILLERARFANLGFEGSDFSIRSVHSKNDVDKPLGHFTICNVSLRRSYTTPVNKVFGWAAIEILDENNQPTPARLGIYDSSGRLPLPSDEAVVLRNSLTGATRVVELGGLSQGLPPWPVKNRSVFYSDGRYHTRLSVGEYELIVARGPEYRLARQRFTVRPNKTSSIKVRLRRWINMAANGWYSGEDHIHYARNSEHDDHNLQLFTRAEDLKVANILQFDNTARTYLAHYDWKPVVLDPKTPFVLVPGQEAPRTTSLGHTIQLHIKEAVRDPSHYLLYHKTFENSRAQGGLAGYAHATGKWGGGAYQVRGMAIDVPFGLVDFAEIMTLHITGAEVWFDFLNLGYKISPTAGTDYPFGGVPGTVRNYVKMNEQFTVPGWFDGLKRGRTFVTSGPMLEVSINGQGVGSEIHVASGDPLVIKAEASMNPDIGALSSLELIEQGKSVKAVVSQGGAPKLKLRHDIPAKHGTWFVLRAQGENPDVIALSAPVYVLVNGESFWKRSEVPSIVARLKSQMEDILRPNQLETIEAWEAQEPFAKYSWEQQIPIKQRIDEANAIYDELVRRAGASTDQP